MELIEEIKRYLNQKKEVVQDSNNNSIEVIDGPHEKVMKFNSIVYSRIRNDSIYTHQYWDFFLPLAHMYKNPNILMIGLGGGTIPFQLEKMLKDKVSIDVIEINKKIAELSREFIPENTRTNIIIGDGADYVHNNAGTYDLVILDAFINASVPNQFFTDDFIEGAYYCLKENGMLAINYLNPPNKEIIMEDFVVKLRRRFNVYRINISLMALNTIIICPKTYDKETVLDKVKSGFPFSRESEFMLKEYNAISEPVSGSFF